jgi:hypothetical protein
MIGGRSGPNFVPAVGHRKGLSKMTTTSPPFFKTKIKPFYPIEAVGSFVINLPTIAPHERMKLLATITWETARELL